MEIHSSSLAYIPAHYKTKNKTAESVLSNNKTKDSSDNNRTLTHPPSKILEEKFDGADLQQLSDTIDRQNKTLSNSRSQRALNIYIEENTQPLKNQRSALISSIDIFV